MAWPKQSGSHIPSVSVIVATYNSATKSSLTRCLESISYQSLSEGIELLVVDGGSSDETVSEATRFGARLIFNPRVTELGFVGGKNLALKNSIGPLVCFVDADNILIESNFLSSLSRPLNSNDDICAAIPCPFIPPANRAGALLRYLARDEDDYLSGLVNGIVPHEGWLEFAPTSITVPNAALIRRSCLERIGGWDYDTEVGRRLITSCHGKFALVPGVHRLHLEARSYPDLWRKLQRRVQNQAHEQSSKPEVQSRLQHYVEHPSRAVFDELIQPLTRMLETGDIAYLNAVPAFIMKSLLVLKYIGLQPRTHIGGSDRM